MTKNIQQILMKLEKKNPSNVYNKKFSSNTIRFEKIIMLKGRKKHNESVIFQKWIFKYLCYENCSNIS
jgi:hypothetical protein